MEKLPIDSDEIVMVSVTQKIALLEVEAWGFWLYPHDEHIIEIGVAQICHRAEKFKEMDSMEKYRALDYLLEKSMKLYPPKPKV